MRVITSKSIANSPYTALITYPPFEVHRNTFFKIMFVESGQATLTLFSKKDEKKQQVLNIKVGDMIIVSPQDGSLYTNVQIGANGYRHRDIYLSVERMKECCKFLSPTLYDEIMTSPFAVCCHITINQQLLFRKCLPRSLKSKKRSFWICCTRASSCIA